MAKNTHCRVIVAIDAREVILTLVDRDGSTIDEERWGLKADADDIQPRSVAVDAFNLLYQCVQDSVHDD